MARRFTREHLGLADLITESAVAVYMVVIINGYVALTDISTSFYYIVALDIGASLAWGLIDGFTSAIGTSADRGRQATFVDKLRKEAKSDQAITEVVEELDDTFLSRFSNEGKRNVASEVLKNSERASDAKPTFFNREDFDVLTAIVAVYLTAGIALSLPYVLLPNKVDAWALSNIIGIAWLFYFGYSVGRDNHL
ncbi:MAG: hypothetical protein ACHQ1H_06065, partial [Nitrososphaerales archaeon]